MKSARHALLLHGEHVPVTFSLRIIGRREIQIGIHPAGDANAARACFNELLNLAGDALDLMRDPELGRSTAT